MKLRVGVVAAVCLLLSVVSLAQDKTFHSVIGHDANSSEFRIRYQIAKRNHVGIAPALPASPLGDDWAVSLGLGNQQLLDQFPSTWGLTNLSLQSPNCTTNYAEFNSNATPSSTQANVLLFNNMFRGTGGLCGTGNPTVYGAYNLGTTQLNGSSAAWSFEGASKGTKIAILERQTALLHIVTLTAGGTLTAPIAPTEVTIDYTNIANSHCAAGTVHTANHSDVYVDYGSDEAYIGDDAGRLYHITGVFNGTQTMDFCTTLNNGAYIQMPIHINIGGTDYVWVMTNGRRLYRTQVNATRTGFGSTTSTIFSSIVGGFASNQIYDINGTDVVAYGWTNHNIAGTQASLYQIDGLATPMVALAELKIGVAVTPSAGTFNGLYQTGYFDNNFFTSGAGGANATGYTCINTNGSTGSPSLASFQFNGSGVITGFTTMTGDTNINVSAATSIGNICTDVVTVFDPIAGVDQLFVGTGNGKTTNTNKLSRFDITSPLTSNSTTPTANAQGVEGGTSAMVIDYTDSGLGGQTQNIYFTNLAAPAATHCGGVSPNFNSCAVKLQQAGLN